MARPIERCRLCRGRELLPVLNLGEMAFTGYFPKSPATVVPSGRLDLVRCPVCGLIQLGHEFDPRLLYGDNYGYRSGLNEGMVRHLTQLVKTLTDIVRPGTGDLVLDIGSNDGTTLGRYPREGAEFVGMDPLAERFGRYYRDDIRRIQDFFSAARFRQEMGDRKARIVTSIAMFYDLEDPQRFVEDVASILAPDGIWHFEQSYLPAMMRQHSYDTICHEHFEYYALRQIQWMCDRAGLKIIRLEENPTNGGSFAVTVARKDSPHSEAEDELRHWRQREEHLGLNSDDGYAGFRDYIFKHRDALPNRLRELKAAGKRVLGYGASTKGNVILQFCGITADLLPAIAEVNPDKFGAFTPGTVIPIISETEARALKPDYYLMLPWHFRDSLIARERAFLEGGGQMIFPLPCYEEVGEEAL